MISFALMMLATATAMLRRRRGPAKIPTTGELPLLKALVEGLIVGLVTGLVGAGRGGDLAARDRQEILRRRRRVPDNDRPGLAAETDGGLTVEELEKPFLSLA